MSLKESIDTIKASLSKSITDNKYVTLLGLDSFAKIIMTYYNEKLTTKLDKQDKTTSSEITEMLNRIKR